MAFIHLKLDDDLSRHAETFAKKMCVKRAAYIRLAVQHFNELQGKEALAERLKKASLACRKESMKTNREIRKAAYPWK